MFWGACFPPQILDAPSFGFDFDFDFDFDFGSSEKDRFVSFLVRTEVITGASKAKECEEFDGDVHKFLATPKLD